ncbi:unnamed protein product, partial [Mycena citricolor]
TPQLYAEDRRWLYSFHLGRKSVNCSLRPCCQSLKKIDLNRFLERISNSSQFSSLPRELGESERRVNANHRVRGCARF